MPQLPREASGDDLILYPGARAPRAWLCHTVDRLVGADPGLNQLRMALQAVLGVGVAVGLSYLFVRLTGALQLPAGSAPSEVLSASNKALLLISMLLAAMVAVVSAFAIQDRTARGQLLSSLFLPVTMLTAFALGLLVGPDHVPSLAFLVAAMAAAVYVRRFGPRGFGAGLGFFYGAFLGYFLHTELALSDVGWIAAMFGIGALASLIVRFVVLRPSPERALARLCRSADARARRLLTLIVGVLGEIDQRHVRAQQQRIDRQLVRLNETMLMIDAQLPDTRPRTAAIEAHRLFDAELALSNCARFAVALAITDASADVRRWAGQAMSALLEDDPVRVSRAVAALREVQCGGHRATLLTSRLATCVEDYAATRPRVGQCVGAQDIPRPPPGASPQLSSWSTTGCPARCRSALRPRPHKGAGCSTAPRCHHMSVPPSKSPSPARSPSWSGMWRQDRDCTGRYWRRSSAS